ncbi:helix-turn-helix domain-containing protein [Paenarthrobacter sp. NPDC057355]|uniref:helix-turn-helix domain-containing protein n=1 Tax=Paenarthrobacter sp. NPDC057355 TaxID=3346105 RepID=UPI003636FEEB
MSVESMAIVMNHSKASGTDKLVLLGIASHDGDGGAWPSIATLARYANVEPRTVQRSINKLGHAGELIVYANDGGTRSLPDYRRPNRYEIALKCPPNCDGTSRHKLVDNYNQTLFKAPKKGVTPMTPPDAHVTPPGDIRVTPPGDAHVTLTVLKNHPLNHPEKSGTSPAKEHICWTCGKPGAKTDQGYCLSCESRGLNNPMISCHCGLRAQRRRHRGQTHFFCPECPPKEALDGKGATP